MAVLYGCTGDNKGGENCVVSGNGQIVSKTSDDGIETKTAVADQWNVFMGWYDGLDKYSNKETITIDKDTPDNLVAKFVTSGTLSANRILNGAYYRYSDAIEEDGKYLNYSYDTTLAVEGNLINASLDVERGGYIGLNGEGYQDFAVVKEDNEILFSQYYIDDTEEAFLYIDIDGRKIKAQDFMSIGSQFIDIPQLSNAVWNLENLVEDNVFSTIDNYIGFRNAVGFIGEVENSKNQTKVVLNVDSLLNELKDKIAMMNDPGLEWLKNAVQTLTNQYAGISNKLPKIVFEVVVDYQTLSGIEKISAVTFKGTFEKSYSIELGGHLLTIPACTMSCKIENVNIELGTAPNKVPNEIILTFPEAVHAVNVHADGTLSFLKENVATLELGVVDQYKIDFDADINPNFVFDAIDDDGNLCVENIDWKELGFISLKISLIENPEDEKQSSRHNGSTEYLNFLIDTEKFGAKAFVYVDLYNPKTLNGTTTSTFILKGVYEIEELIEFIPEIIEGFEEEQEAEPEGATQCSMPSQQLLVANILSASIKGAYDLSNADITEGEFLFDLMIELLNKIVPNNQFIENGLSYSEFGSTLAVEEIKNLIASEFKIDDTLSSLGLENNIFGDKTTHIAINTDCISYGAVNKMDGEYVDKNGKSFADEYNSAHKMLIAVAEESKVQGIDDEKFTKEGIENEVASLKGKSLKIETGLFSDGTLSSTFENCQGNQAELAMRVYRARYEMVDENTAKITVYLSFSAGTVQSLLVNTFDIPYGLIEYSTTVSLN